MLWGLFYVGCETLVSGKIGTCIRPCEIPQFYFMAFKKEAPLHIGIAVAAACWLTLTSCSERTERVSVEQTNPPQPTIAAATQRTIEDACTLLTAEEIQSVQGEPLKDAQTDRKEANGLMIAQCFFALPSYERSVSLVLVQKGAGTAARSPVESWREMFSAKTLQEPQPDATKKKMPPMRVADLGDEAFWVGNNTIGVLHVLKADGYITLSVGGPEDQAAKIEKTKALARLILPRL